MKCHYEVMELPRDATMEDIKKQYKKLALKWHPDRNYGQEELATQTFKEISSAYGVLSDPQERQWYDDHREAILRGKDGTRGDGDDEEDDIMPDIFSYFNTSCFSGFNDDEGGFYDVYSTIFDEIVDAEEERGSGDPNLPEFGDSASTETEVYAFYSAWENFVTTVTFTWHDKYNTLEAGSRQVKRAMEKENSKFRDSARKEYISQVKSLVAFVKKRDPRYAQYESDKKQRKVEALARSAELKKAEIEKRKADREKWRQAAAEDREHREQERQRAFLLADNDSDYDEDSDGGMDALATTEFLPSSSGATGGENALDETVFALKGVSISSHTPGSKVAGVAAVEGDGEGEGGEEDGAEGGFACDVCAKYYKAVGQLNQHLQSKVHRKKVQELEKEKKKKGGGGNRGDVGKNKAK